MMEPSPRPITGKACLVLYPDVDHRHVLPADMHTPSVGTQTSFQGCNDEPRNPTKKIGVSRLTFPFNPRRKVVPFSPPSLVAPMPKRAPEPPVRQKHQCPPSPLGPASETSVSVATPVGALFKHNACYHGYSRHSFLLTKWVWSTRHAQFEARSSDHVDETVIASDATLPKLMTSRPSYLRLQRLRFYSEEKRPEQPPLTTYPRQGDIAALRDPYCARADRSFATVPLWTLNKIICLAALLIPKPREEDALEESGSEDTDSTLIDSDSEWDASTTCSSRHDDDIVEDPYQAKMSKGHLLALAVHRANFAPDVSTGHMATTVWLCKFYLGPTFNFSRDQTWPSNWYGLWELLIELARRDAGSADKSLEVKGRPPKELRWLKLLGNSKATKPSAPVKGVDLGSGAPHGSLGVLRSSFLRPSHPAAG